MPGKNKYPKRFFLHARSAHFYRERSELHFYRSTFLVLGAATIAVWLFLFLFIFLAPHFRTVLHGAASAVGFQKKVVTSEAKPTFIFSDVPSSHPNAEAFRYLKNRNMINGYKDGLFKPNETLNRAEFLKLLVSAVNAYPTTVSYAQCFKDVKNEWFAPTICYAKSKGWISGYADKSFHPSDPVKKAEALKIVLSAFKAKFLTVSPDVSFVDVADDEWFASYVWTAQRDLLLQEKPTLNREYKPLAPVTRAEVVELLYRALKTYSASI